MTTSWYYDSHEKGAFPHQQQLCVAVQWTKCNLEGQRLKSPTVLSAIQGNPLTIRLLALDEALEHFDNAKTIDKKIKELAEEQFSKNGHSSMGVTWKDERSSLNTKGAPIEIIEIAGEDLEFKHIDIQLALYEFLTNFGSVLDRLAYEINMLYDLGIPKRELYWSNLKKEINLTKLDGKDEALTKLLREYSESFKLASRYRNRLVHDGIIKIETNPSHSGLDIMLAEDPKDDESPMNVDAIKFCNEAKANVLKLLDRSYELMLQHHQNHGNPPW